MSELLDGPTVAALDPDQMRRVLGHFATGVVVVATEVDGQAHGFSANSFASLSLDPPLVLFCPARTSSTWPHLRAAGRFAISVLGSDGEDLCRTFARRGVDRFAGATWLRSPAGSPVLDGALAWLDCTLETVHEAGDHDIAVCRVQALGAAEETSALPLVFWRGRYGLPDRGAGEGSGAWT